MYTPIGQLSGPLCCDTLATHPRHIGVIVQPTSRLRPSYVLKLTRLRDRRLDEGLSQEQLEARSGVSRTTIIKVEAGREAWPSTASKLAKALRLRVADLR